MIFWFFAGAEVLLQMRIGMSWFWNPKEPEKDRTWWKSTALLFLLLLIFCFELYDKGFSLLSWMSVATYILMESVWLRLWTGKSITHIFPVVFFLRWTMTLAEMSAVIVCSFRGGHYEGMSANRHPDVYGKMIQCTILILMLLGLKIRKQWKDSVWEMLTKTSNTTLFWFGLGEWGLIIFLMNMIWESAEVVDLILNVLLVVSIFILLGIQVFRRQYRIMELETKMYLERERILERDYALLKQEIRRKHKDSHDYRFDLTYLYECFQSGQLEKGIKYIEKKQQFEKSDRQVEQWTGYECIDFLIQQGRLQAEQNGIEFTAASDITRVPMQEYEFFTVLGNLLDNALEAAGQCREGERRISLRMKSANDMFLFTLENTYETEPVQKAGKFLSRKGEPEKHGWGLVNVRETVEKNAGTMKIEYDHHKFMVRMRF